MKEETKAVFENLTFGTELEYEGITRGAAAEAICKALRKTWSEASIRYVGGGYDTWEITHTTGTWKVTRDGSLLNGGAEVVTPVLCWVNMPVLQEVVRELRHAGAKATERGSQHVHIGIADFTALQLANMARIWYKQEDLFLKSAGTLERRINNYCHTMNHSFVHRLNRLKSSCTLADGKTEQAYVYVMPEHKTRRMIEITGGNWQ